jgi:riboflavin synthase
VWLTIRPPEDLVRYLVEKGSVSVDGISLTVAGLDDGTFSVALIPHTLNVTTMRAARVGDPVNLEVDLIAKYVERLVAGQGAERRAGGQERSNATNGGAGR